MTLAEAFERPTPMLHRHLLVMEVEQGSLPSSI